MSRSSAVLQTVREPAVSADDSPRGYGVYGLTLRSTLPLHLLPRPGAAADIELDTAPDAYFTDALRDTVVRDGLRSYARLPDGRSYARWKTVGEYLVSADGRRITGRAFDGATDGAFHAYLLGQALSFALVKLGLEPLHGTAVVVDGRAVAFLGSSHSGKSTLAASFAAAGHELLTDDLLVLRRSPQGAMLAYPGPPHIKLYANIARRLMRRAVRRVPVHEQAPKLILSLEGVKARATPAPLAALYVLGSARESRRGQGCRIEPLSGSERFLRLVAHTYNEWVLDARRLQRHFAATAGLDSIPVRRLVYPRDFHRLADVRDAICTDLSTLSLE